MNRPAYTASAADRAEQCPASCALPQVQRTTLENTGGSVVHRFLELASNAGRDEAIAQVPAEERDALEAMPLELYPLHLSAEVAVAYDVMSGEGRILAVGKGRAYDDVQDTEVCGTADAAGVDERGVVVVDYKPPWMPLPPPAVSGQLGLLALALARAHGVDSAALAWCRYRGADDPQWERATLDAFDLDAVADKAKRTWVAVVRARAVVAAGKEPDVHTGEWCRYCPAVAHCPAHRTMVLELARGSGGIEGQLTPQLAGAAHVRLQMLKRAIGHMERAIRSYAEHQPLELPDGRRLGYVDEPGRESMPDGDAVWRAITDKHGRDVADAAVTRSTSKAAIRDALRPVAKAAGGKLAPLERELHDDLRRESLLVAKPTRSLKVLDD